MAYSNDGIRINIVVSDNVSERNVHISGRSVDIISNKEIDTFKLNDGILKKAVAKHFGASPTDAYLKSPTPWNDLYRTYGWKQVTRTLTPTSARIIGVSTKPIILLNQRLDNTHGPKKAKFSTKIHQAVQNTVSSNWEKGGELTVGKEISYGIDIKAVSVSGKSSIAYTNQWGKGKSKSENVSVGSESGVEIELDPGQVAIAELHASRGIMKIQIDYVATLSGDIAVNYENTHKGHHFWQLEVNSVMNTSGMSRSVKSTEIIQLGYYSDSSVVIRDAKSKTKLRAIPT